MNEDYQKQLEAVIDKNQTLAIKPSLLLHCCCAPCSSYVLEYLDRHFEITAYFYNPNISNKEEYLYRAEELERLISGMPLENPVELVVEKYSPHDFLEIAKGRETLPEGGLRCYECYRLRLEGAADRAQRGGFDYFCTTLSISPHKNAAWLNKIGGMSAQQYETAYLYSDFKKRNGYKRSCDLSKQYGLYRQDFCGCEFSQLEAKNRRK